MAQVIGAVDLSVPVSGMQSLSLPNCAQYGIQEVNDDVAVLQMAIQALSHSLQQLIQLHHHLQVHRKSCGNHMTTENVLHSKN